MHQKSPQRYPQCFENMIRRAEAPEHGMQITALAYPVSAEIQGRQIAYSEHAVYVQEVGGSLYRPVIYFPPEDVNMGYFQQTGKTTRCPLKGETDYYDIHCAGLHLRDASWTYNVVYDFDSRLACLEGKLAFDHEQIRINELTDVDLLRKANAE